MVDGNSTAERQRYISHKTVAAYFAGIVIKASVFYLPQFLSRIAVCRDVIVRFIARRAELNGARHTRELSLAVPIPSNVRCLLRG